MPTKHTSNEKHLLVKTTRVVNFLSTNGEVCPCRGNVFLAYYQRIFLGLFVHKTSGVWVASEWVSGAAVHSGTPDDNARSVLYAAIAKLKRHDMLKASALQSYGYEFLKREWDRLLPVNPLRKREKLKEEEYERLRKEQR